MARLDNKVALVTGAARGIGQAIAATFAREGARVIVTDIDDTLGQASASQIGATWIRLDVRDEMAWTGALARVLDSHGRLDVLVNNAGNTGLEPAAGGAPHPHDPEHASLEDWHAVHRTNLDGVFLGCKHGIRAMRTQGAGSIVTISSRSGIVGVPAAAAYASSKAAVRNHTKSVALYCAERWPRWPCCWPATSRPMSLVRNSMSTAGCWPARQRCPTKRQRRRVDYPGTPRRPKTVAMANGSA